jgi:mRNA interferase YafQ
MTWPNRLRTHKLSGHLEGVWGSSAGQNVRILFDFVDHRGAEAILLLTVGTHDEVY